MFALDGDKGARTVNAHAVAAADAAWEERSVTAANCPAFSAEPVAAASVKAPFGWVAWDVTEQMRKWGGAGVVTTVSFALQNGEKTEKTHSWAAREAGAGKAARLVFSPK